MRRITLIMLVLIAVAQCFAASFTLNGIVTDEFNEPIIGANVMLLNRTDRVTITDYDGKFTLRITDFTPNETIRVSYIGYQTKECIITGKETDIKIILEEDAATLDEVVVVGYGTSKRSMVTGAISGRVAGLSVSKSKGRKSKGSGPSTTSGIKSGTLTAGEVNDFAKWDQWEKILVNDFSSHLNLWKIRPLNRYAVQVVNQHEMPVSNAAVTLSDEFGFILWESITDNTGKAELWLHPFEAEQTVPELKISIDYQGTKHQIHQVKNFADGINYMKIDAECDARNTLDIFFIVDATGSMGDEIRYLQIELEDIIKTIQQNQKGLKLRVGSLVYRDKGDDYVTRKSSLSEDISQTIDFLKKQHASGGGDYPEAVDMALYESIENEDWNEDAEARIAFLVLDAPGHSDAVSRDRLVKQTQLAAQKGIRIVPIACSDIQKDGEYLMRCIALATNGTYLFLTDDSGVGNKHIKPTTDKYEVEKLNEAIVRIVNQYIDKPSCSDDNWVKENRKFAKADNFVPNPYDQEPEKKAEKLNSGDLLKVYPNPCKNFLKVELKENVDDLFLVDMTGKSLSRHKAGKKDILEMDFQHLAAGIYFVKVYHRGKWFSEKIIKTNL